MKKFFLFSALFTLLSCSDGDLQIETLDFSTVTAQNCGTLTVDTELFFKINDNEALILNLQDGILKNEVSTEEITSAISDSGSKLTYRTFSGTVTSSYFCDSPPPATPTVLEEIEAAEGIVTISTVAGETEGTFVHTIKLSNITLLNNDDTRITDLNIEDFAVITTTISQ
ncbi:hypothetical protein M4I21_09015 [Cellulophaga sp. 20_2_10]|uniref:hypothetical protein n=1 Tax=Cellulophaga sp. 20_2_10 TaxID=2942476 RepID=UPI00201AEC53|nr:hypothetical protein [Cellulophaga sp. 20_2_10]MCL5245943.1 hypothetical protein [Cellulophaga sp. 20_2_10]